MFSKEEARKILSQLTDKIDVEFKPGQWEAIDAVVNRRKKVLVVQKTGWGKSAVYFIAVKLLQQEKKGLGIVISPLLALIRNQIDAGIKAGLHCSTIHSGNRKDWWSVKNDIFSGKVDLLFISPERLADEGFIENVLIPISEKINLFIVDEVHCISDWGHDFRPDYKRISHILKQLPANTPILGTTATANDRVVEDVINQFGQEIEIQRGELTRDSIYLDSFKIPDMSTRLAFLVKLVNSIEGTGIIYVSVIRDAILVRNWLCSEGIKAEVYYGGLSDEEREPLEVGLINNNFKALVATTALGMGFDKPDLGFVIHFQMPSNIISYYQQVGRAGRGIDKSYGVLLSGVEDSQIQEYFRNHAFPSEEEINTILEILLNSDGLRKVDILERSNMKASRIDAVLKYLSALEFPPVIKKKSVWYRTINSYKPDKEFQNWLIKRKEKEWEEMVEYLETDSCKMQFLANSLDSAISPCGHCSSCLGGHLFTGVWDESTLERAKLFLMTQYDSFEPKKRLPRQGLFLNYSFLNSSSLSEELCHETGYILSQWGSEPFGTLVAEQKHNRYFEDVLVIEFVKMLNANGIPEQVKWVTCVPSQSHPELVEDFASRVAKQMGLPFLNLIKKEKISEPQKLQNNTVHQCLNLDGVFAINSKVPEEPVLLIDDIYDSGWTFCIVAALLRNAGAGKVFPAALARTTSK